MMNLSYSGTISNHWETISENVYQIYVDNLEYTTSNQQGWFDENYYEILLLLEERRSTHHALLFNRHETENSAMRKHNLNCKHNDMSSAQCLVGLKKPMIYNS